MLTIFQILLFCPYVFNPPPPSYPPWKIPIKRYMVNLIILYSGHTAYILFVVGCVHYSTQVFCGWGRGVTDDMAHIVDKSYIDPFYTYFFSENRYTVKHTANIVEINVLLGP